MFFSSWSHLSVTHPPPLVPDMYYVLYILCHSADFNNPTALRDALLSTCDVTLMVKACRAVNVRQTDVFRTPWPFVQVQVQQQNEVVRVQQQEQERLETEKEEERKRNEMNQGGNKAKITKKVKKAKKPNKGKDPLWPTIHLWESYECDNTIHPEWEDAFTLRLNDIGLDPSGKKNIKQTKQTKNTEGKEAKEAKETKEMDETGEMGKGMAPAGHVDASLRLYVQVFDREKGKAIKLGTLDCLNVRTIPVLIGNPPSLEEKEKNPKMKRSRSEKEYPITFKKEEAGDLYLDVRLKPSEGMVSAGKTLYELFTGKNDITKK